MADTGEKPKESAVKRKSIQREPKLSAGKPKETPKWYIFHGDERKLPDPPPWRNFTQSRDHKGRTFRVGEEEIMLVNAALYLRRPLLVTGLPGTGKSSLAYAVATELGLGEVLVWPITSRSRLKDGLYDYDAIGRLQASNMTKSQSGGAVRPPPIGDFIVLGPLGTALADSRKNRPRVLLIDEIDKSDIDLPNDLLNVFEEGEFEIPELARLAYVSQEKIKSSPYTTPDSNQPVSVRTADKPRNNHDPDTVEIVAGRVRCEEFPFVILTSNGERELPAPFLRRCLRLEIKPPDKDKLQEIVRAHFKQLPDSQKLPEDVVKFIGTVVDRRNQKKEYVATDQLLNAVYLILNEVELISSLEPGKQKQLQDFILETISTSL